MIGYSTSQIYKEIPTVQDGPFDPTADAITIRKSISGCCKNKKGAIAVICRRTDPQRVQIVAAYKNKFGRHLSLDLKSVTSHNLEKLLVALVTPKYDYLAGLVRSAVKGLGTDEAVLIDVICTASSPELRAIHMAYSRIYDRGMEKDIAEDTSYHFRKLLFSLCTAQRSEDLDVNVDAARSDAQNLIAAGIKKLGTDEETFNTILVHRSYPHLRAVFQEYAKLAHEDIEKSIKKEFSGDIKAGLLAIVKCAKNRAGYFAERLHDAIKGLGTKDDLLIFIMATRADVDMENIKVEYERFFRNTLILDIEGDTSGLYKQALLTLLNANF